MASTGVACDVCFESAYASIENKLLTSVHCGHRVCRRCLHRQQQCTEAATTANLAATTDGPTQKIQRTAAGSRNQGLKCPVCQSGVSIDDWMDRGLEETLFEQERLIRQRVLNVYNSARDNFESTPLYNNYLERREETIYELAFGSDDSRKKVLQEELQTADNQNQKEITECRQKAKQKEEEEIKDIVDKEGVFYEIVSQDYGPGFRYSKAAENSLVHILQRQHPQLFAADDNESASQQPTSSELGTAQPRPIISGLVYEKIAKKAHTDRAAMYRACGYFKERVFQRITQELWGGCSFCSA
ncbi:uncharacterized protein LOC129618114 [Condylostylus longicornis]|uniref:uncharacterized protein LOC129618114 n=1 Tax=Condylostylus longicornis TaxID=2530218 RepID=UPI00244D9DCE|nr:uncharacterized protein LOC129618114 [Condylostylus longicornis]